MNDEELDLEETDPLDLEIDELRELLLEIGADLTEEQVEQLAALVTQAGGTEAALAALSQLTQLRNAA